MRQANVAQLFEYHRERLQLLRVGGNLDAPIAINHLHASPADLAGHLNLIHPDRIQVIGAPEINWATKQHAVRVSRHMEEIIAAHPPAVIVADGCAIPASVREACEKSDTALFSTPQSAAIVIDLLRLWLSRQLAETVELHAVMMDVLGMGVPSPAIPAWEKRAGAGTHLARPRPGGRRHRRDRPCRTQFP